MSWLAWALLVTEPAQAADEIEVWGMLAEILLIEAADGDLPRAAVAYEQLVRHLPDEDPMRAEALYHLGDVRYRQGDVDGARAALREGIRVGHNRDQCLVLLGRVELEQSAIHEVPVYWRFDGTSHGFVHPWARASRGSIHIEEEAGALGWTTTVDARADDQLVVGFRNPQPSPRGIRLEVQSMKMDAHLRMLVYDVFGRKYTSARGAVSTPVPVGETIVIDVEMASMVALDANQGPLDPQRLDRVIIQDVTGYVGRETGPNTLLIDNFEVY